MIIFNQKPQDDSERVASLQISLGTVYTQLISVREMLAEREAQLSEFKKMIAPHKSAPPERADYTLTVVEVLIKLYRLLFLPRER